MASAASTSPSQHAAFLATQTVADVLKAKTTEHPLIDIHVSATVEKVFETLLSNDILSVPVYRIFNNVKDYVAIIDTYDLLSSMAERGFEVESGSSPDTEFLSMPVAILVGMTKSSSKLWTCLSSLPLPQLFELFTKHRVHRILVLEEIPVRWDEVDQEEAEAKPRQQPNGRLVSQTDVIRFLLEHNHQLGSILDTTAEQTAGHALRYAQEYLDTAAAVQLKQTPASITINCVAWTALQTMSTSQASCVAIVDSNGALVAEMSAADLRGLNPDRIQDLNRPVLVYLKTCQGKGNVKQPLSCRTKFTLGQVLSGLVRSHGHRSWLVDEENRPIGCITLSDVLSLFSE
ncbi:hypothetical protein EMPS_01252 [Entomortierella parvispora]|uniref:CBS domain-containing protein n=1 Tax=Entomortierella parvispora TaxID=205924 RepID=A0A9P3LSD2_9FUNG|nr:hypothetical protein EMPS_01252 [Entomortierella parvispora]